MITEPEKYIFGEIFERDCNLPPKLFYCKTDYVWNFVEFAKQLDHEFVVVSHNSDHAITQKLSDYIDVNLPNLVKWFGQNIDCINPRIESLPIGLENTKNFTKFSKKDLLFEYSLKDIQTQKLVYANFSLWTNPMERNRCFDFVKKSKFITNECSTNVLQDGYESWLSNVKLHEYVLCPVGNGIDTHRLWETLYLGRVPIVISNNNTRFYENLPILFVNDWLDITEELLLNKMNYFSDKSKFDFNLLDINYWKNKINQYLK